jgi:hypothetical protein
MTTSNRIPVLTPQRHLVFAPAVEVHTLPDNLLDRLESAFERGVGHWLLELGIREVGTALPADFAYWRDFAGRYVTTLMNSLRPEGLPGRASFAWSALPSRTQASLQLPSSNSIALRVTALNLKHSSSISKPLARI